jgi:hypothetical protein
MYLGGILRHMPHACTVHLAGRVIMGNGECEMPTQPTYKRCCIDQITYHTASDIIAQCSGPCTMSRLGASLRIYEGYNGAIEADVLRLLVPAGRSSPYRGRSQTTLPVRHVIQIQSVFLL